MVWHEQAADAEGGRSRRGLGPRQRAIMSVLWSDLDRFLTVREVSERLDVELAYTTVMTLLGRLYDKGYVARRLDGRAWTYRPSVSREEHAARAMAAALRDTENHNDTLLRFVEHLTPQQQQALRRRLDEG